MSIRTQHEFLFVGRDEGSFVENYAYDLGEGGSSGKIYICIEVQNNPVDAEAIGETIFDSLRKTFFADLESDPYTRFEEAVRSVNKSLVAMKEEKASKYLGNLNVVIAAVVGKTLHVTQTGEAEAYLIRRRLCSTVSEGLSDEDSQDVFSNIASGTLDPGDLILFSSTRLLRYISKTDLAKICSGRNLIASLSELKDYLMTEVLGRVGFVGITVKDVAPDLNETEKGQISAHLEKEESYSKSTNEQKRSGVAVKRAIDKLTGVVADLSRRIIDLGRKGGRSSIASKSDDRVIIAGLKKDQLLTVAIIAVIVLIIGIWWMKMQATEQEMIDNYADLLTEVREEIGSAETTGQYNKDQAGQMLNDAEKKALEVLNSGYHRSKANEYLDSIQKSRDVLDGVIYPDMRVLADLSEKRENVSALGLLSVNDVLYAYEYNALYPVVLDQVQDPITIDENETVLTGTVYDDKDSLLFYTKSGKVMEFKDGRTTFVDTADPSFKRGVAVEGYSNKFYILDSEENQIWRYTRRRDKFDGAEAYNLNADIQNGIDIAIDGNIYVLHEDGFITKIFSGNKEDFPRDKEPTHPMTRPTKIYTDIDMSEIYILEPESRRVLIYYKNDRTGGATYSKQLVFDEVVDLRDMYVDKDTNKLYLLDQTKVYEVSL